MRRVTSPRFALKSALHRNPSDDRAGMDPRERRALALIGTLAIAGHLIRAARSSDGSTASARLVATGLPASGDPRHQLAVAESLARPLGAAERIDVDRASEAELERLPGVGAALAARIVADRRDRGAFGGGEGLSRVAGVGPATLARLAPHLSFSGRPADAGQDASALPLSLNRAGPRELERLPGIGAARASAIIAFRDSAGPFRQIGDLNAVPGLPRALVQRLSGLVRFD